jgi:pimeloyl-ACP methyl ester carboxylesterase
MKITKEMQINHDTIDKQYNHFTKQAGGVNWHGVEMGDSNGEVVLLVHGLPEGFYSWGKIMPLLDQSFRIIAIDLKGYGRSTCTGNNYNWQHIAGQLMALMDAMNIQKFHVVGHDWGALITSIMVGDFPERILSYVRMEADIFSPANPNESFKKKPQWKLFQKEWLGRFVMGRTRFFIDLVYNDKRMTSVMSTEDREFFYYEFGRPDVATAVCQYFLAKNWDLDAALDKIAYNNFAFPVLLLQADKDPAQPISLFEKVPELCKNCELKFLTNASHFSNLDQPEQVADAINEMVRREKQNA